MIKHVDKKGRVMLPADFADSDVIIETISDVECRIILADIRPRLSAESKRLLMQGIEEAKAGKIRALDLSLLADDDEE